MSKVKLFLPWLVRILLTTCEQQLLLSKTFHRPPGAGQHHEGQLQGAGAAVPAAGDGRHHVRIPHLRVREGGGDHHLPHHVRLLLVGHHHHDHGKSRSQNQAKTLINN